MTVHAYFDWLNEDKRGRHYSNLVFQCALKDAPRKSRQRKHVQKHTYMSFHEFLDRCFKMMMVL